VAYVGLSTPLCYDYQNQASKAPSDSGDSPNPILDSPFGLMLLYDEIWFLCRSLCPENMRESPHVRFLDESKMLPSLDEIHAPTYWKDIDSNPTLEDRFLAREHSALESYRETLRRIGVYWDAGFDNHTHGLQIGGVHVFANAFSLENLLFDMEVVKRMQRPDLELLTNAVSQSWLDGPTCPFLRTALTEILTIENIPNYLTPKGPYHPCVEEARDEPHLKRFRKWISTRTAPQRGKEKLVMKRSVERAIQQIENEIFLKTLDPRTHFWSTGRTVVGTAVNLAIPIIPSLRPITEQVEGYFADGKRRWQGFNVSSRTLRS